MEKLFGHNSIVENINSVISDKLLLRFLQDNFITNQELIKTIDDFIAMSRRKDLDTETEHCIHNTMFSLCLKIVAFKFLYQLLKVEYLEQWPDSCWSDLVNRL